MLPVTYFLLKFTVYNENLCNLRCQKQIMLYIYFFKSKNNELYINMMAGWREAKDGRKEMGS